MAFRDNMHKFLVYFGLADDSYDYDYEDEHETAIDEPIPETGRRSRTGTVARLERSSARGGGDDFDDIFADEGGRSHRGGQLRSIDGGGRSAVADLKVHFVTPRNFNDAQEVADHFKRSTPVILNLQGAGTELSKRLIDFSSGLTYAMDGGMQKIADKTFMLTPRNVEVSAEEKARLVEKGFFNQS